MAEVGQSRQVSTNRIRASGGVGSEWLGDASFNVSGDERGDDATAGLEGVGTRLGAE